MHVQYISSRRTHKLPFYATQCPIYPIKKACPSQGHQNLCLCLLPLIAAAVADGEGPVVGESEAVREAVDDVATVVVSAAALVHLGQHAQTAQLLGPVAVSAPLGARRDAPVLHPRALRPAAADAGQSAQDQTSSTLSLSLSSTPPTTKGTQIGSDQQAQMGMKNMENLH